MLPHHGFHTNLWTLARVSYLLIADPGTPIALRHALLKLVRKLKKELPAEARFAIAAAEAEAAIKELHHLRRSGERSAD